MVVESGRSRWLARSGLGVGIVERAGDGGILEQVVNDTEGDAGHVGVNSFQDGLGDSVVDDDVLGDDGDEDGRVALLSQLRKLA